MNLSQFSAKSSSVTYLCFILFLTTDVWAQRRPVEESATPEARPDVSVEFERSPEILGLWSDSNGLPRIAIVGQGQNMFFEEEDPCGRGFASMLDATDVNQAWIDHPLVGAGNFAEAIGKGHFDNDGVLDLVVGVPNAGGVPTAEVVTKLGQRINAEGYGALFFYSGQSIQSQDASPISLGIVSGKEMQPLEQTARSGNFGQAIAVIQDLTGDGLNEMFVSASEKNKRDSRGRLYLIDGNGNKLDEIAAGSDWLSDVESTSTFREELGTTIVNLGDLDGDDLDEVGVGTAIGGYVLILSTKKDANQHWRITHLKTLYAMNPNQGHNDFFGTTIASVGDLDGDGKPEFMIGSPLASAPNDIAVTGSFTIYSGDITDEDWGPLYGHNHAVATRYGAAFRHLIGGGATDLPDINDDGVPDFAVGANPSVVIYSGSNGQVIGELEAFYTNEAETFPIYVRSMMVNRIDSETGRPLSLIAAGPINRETQLTLFPKKRKPKRNQVTPLHSVGELDPREREANEPELTPFQITLRQAYVEIDLTTLWPSGE